MEVSELRIPCGRLYTFIVLGRCQVQHAGAAAARSAAPTLSLGAESRARAEELQALIQRRVGSRPAFTLEQAPQVLRTKAHTVIPVSPYFVESVDGPIKPM